ncbi:MAG: extracellular solute-binding protein [Eubacteriales bacterium]
MTYTILARPVNKADIDQIAPEAMNGEVVNDAVYERNQTILDYYGTKIEWLECEENQYVNTFARSVMAGEDVFQFAAVHVVQSGTLAQQELLMDFSEIPYIDMTNPWWNQTARETLTIKDKIFIAQNDIPTYTVICSNHVMYFNKSIAEKYKIPDVYELIHDGKWTLDKMTELAKSVASDINGDDKMDEEDLWGLITTSGSTSIFLPSCEQPIMKNDSNGIPTLALNTPKMATIVEKLYEICFESGATLFDNISKETDFCKLFADGHSLFYNGYVADMNLMRDMRDEYGLIPAPKFDETQENYYTLIQGSSDLVVIPVSLPEEKYEFVGMITEALAALSYRDVRPAIYEEALKGKYMRDFDSQEMLDLISRNIVIDFGMVYQVNSDISFPIWNILESKSADFASWYASREATAEAKYEKVIQILTEN